MVRLDTESFHGDYTVTGILSNVGEKEGNTCAIAVSKASLTQWAGFDSAGYRAYVHFQNDEQLSQEVMAAYCQEIAARYGLPHVGMNSSYFAYTSKSIDFAAIGSIAALVLIGGYVVIQSIFRISIQDKIQSYGYSRVWAVLESPLVYCWAFLAACFCSPRVSTGPIMGWLCS